MNYTISVRAVRGGHRALEEPQGISVEVPGPGETARDTCGGAGGLAPGPGGGSQMCIPIGACLPGSLPAGIMDTCGRRGKKRMRELRNGYTTGTCAAAAATAAAWYVFGGQERGEVQVELPGGGLAELTAKKEPSRGPGKEGKEPPAWPGEEGPWFFVEKDAGDDPDVTDKTNVWGTVEPLEEGRREESMWYCSQEYPHLFLTGGPGIGVVTRPGLACPVGAYAINPVPRAMIFRQVGELYNSLGAEGDYLIRIKIPQGTELAKKTFNPRLGIEGGLSVLGTSGIVRPMSEQALKDTIRLEIHMKAAAGEDSLLLVPGNYGEHFLKETLGIWPDQAVRCSNFVADAVDMAVEENIKRILLIGHIGKLVKVAGGARNTHSRFGDRRMEILAESLGRVAERERKEAISRRLLACNTTEEAILCLTEEGLKEAVMEDVTGRIWEQLNRWGQGKADIQVLTFSSVYGILAMSRLCGPMIEEWRERQR